MIFESLNIMKSTIDLGYGAIPADDAKSFIAKKSKILIDYSAVCLYYVSTACTVVLVFNIFH